MKTILILTAAVIGAFSAAAASANTMLGCEVVPVEGSNYVVKADPTCGFQIITASGAEAKIEDLIDAIENGVTLPN